MDQTQHNRDSQHEGRSKKLGSQPPPSSVRQPFGSSSKVNKTTLNSMNNN